MIDLHNHLLPGIDDGAENIEQSLKLARIAVGDGITHLVCTPHIHPGRYDNTQASIAVALQQLRRALVAEGIDLRVSAAAEVRFGVELMAGIAEGSIPFLGEWQGQKVLLLEFPHADVPFGAEKLTGWLLSRNIRPMIAHPERNKGLMKNPARLKPFLEQGCLLQMTAGALVGRFGGPCRELAESLLQAGKVTILATDAHNTKYRPPLLAEGMQAAAAIVGERAAIALASGNPRIIAQTHF